MKLEGKQRHKARHARRRLEHRYRIMPTETHRHCGIIFSRDAKRRLVRTYRLTPTEAGRHLALILNLRRQHQRGNEVKRTWEGGGATRRGMRRISQTVRGRVRSRMMHDERNASRPCGSSSKAPYAHPARIAASTASVLATVEVRLVFDVEILWRSHRGPCRGRHSGEGPIHPCCGPHTFETLQKHSDCDGPRW